MRVLESPTGLEFRPANPDGRSALIFICGSGVHAHAYAPLLRPIANAGYPVFIVKLPYRFAPLAPHKDEVVGRTQQLMTAHPEIPRWVVAGHSLGGALAARVALSTRGRRVSFVLIGTTHPRDHDLSKVDAPIAKVYATNDGVAPVDGVMANKRLLPATTAWVEIKGGNHSQFGHYGHQLFDGTATITREAQQATTRQVLLDILDSRAGHARSVHSRLLEQLLVGGRHPDLPGQVRRSAAVARHRPNPRVSGPDGGNTTFFLADSSFDDDDNNGKIRSGQGRTRACSSLLRGEVPGLTERDHLPWLVAHLSGSHLSGGSYPPIAPCVFT